MSWTGHLHKPGCFGAHLPNVLLHKRPPANLKACNMQPYSNTNLTATALYHDCTAVKTDPCIQTYSCITPNLLWRNIKVDLQRTHTHNLHQSTAWGPVQSYSHTVNHAEKSLCSWESRPAGLRMEALWTEAKWGDVQLCLVWPCLALPWLSGAKTN